MKDLVISVMTAWIITGMDFWEFSKATDRPIITLALALIVFVMMVAAQEWIREYRMKKWRAERFFRNFKMENRP